MSVCTSYISAEFICDFPASFPSHSFHNLLELSVKIVSDDNHTVIFCRLPTFSYSVLYICGAHLYADFAPGTEKDENMILK